jgi:hypothetical protein
VFLAIVVVPVFPCGTETALVDALSFCGPETGALTVNSGLPDTSAADGGGGPATVPGATTVGCSVSFVTVCFPPIAVGGRVAVTVPALAADSVVFVVVASLVPVEPGAVLAFEAGAETTGAGLLATTVAGALAVGLCEGEAEVLAPVFGSLETAAISPVWRAVLAGGGVSFLPVDACDSAAPLWEKTLEGTAKPVAGAIFAVVTTGDGSMKWSSTPSGLVLQL